MSIKHIKILEENTRLIQELLARLSQLESEIEGLKSGRQNTTSGNRKRGT